MKEKLSYIIIKSENVLKKILVEVVNCLTTIVWTILWLPMAWKYAMEDSYFPERRRKNVIKRVVENTWWVLKYHRANGFYTLYGLDLHGRSSKEYIDENSFWKKLNKLNYNKGLTSQICLLRDKYMFYKYMQGNSLPVPEVFGIIREGKLYSVNLIEQSWEVLKEEKDYFVKDIDGECASFVKHISTFEEFENILPRIKSGTYILQKAICQSQEMNKLYPNSINTLRIVTVKSGGEIKVLSSLLRVGTSATGNVDNWAVGGLIIGIQSNGTLKKYGFYKPRYGKKTTIHPDSGIVFEGYRISMLQEAYDLAVKAHKFFYNIDAIGWDVALTESGPVFIEGNDNFEITMLQACDRPLKEEWKII